MLAQLRKAKVDRLPLEDVIEIIVDNLDRESAWRYRPYLDFFNALEQVRPILLPPGMTLYPWQKACAAFCALPIVNGDTNLRGLWLNLPPNAGKSWLGCYLHDTYGADLFIPGMRNATYDWVSFRTYNGQSIIFINDLACHEREDANGQRVFCWKRSVINVLKGMCERLPQALEFGGTYTKLYFNARVVITSNFPLPAGSNDAEGDALRRRFLRVDDPQLCGATIADYAATIAPPEAPLSPAPAPGDLHGERASGEPVPPVPPVPPPAPRHSPSLAPERRRRSITIAPLAIGSDGNSVPLQGAPPSSPPGLLTTALRVRQPRQLLVADAEQLPGCAPRFLVQPVAFEGACAPGFVPPSEHNENAPPQDLMHFDL